MKLSAALVRRLHWLNLPGALLIALLQRTPLLRVAAAAGEIIHASPVGAVLRAAVATAASLGALHSLAGATTLSVSSGAESGVSGTVGAQLGPIAMGTIGTQTQPLSWQISGTIPAGVRFLSSSGVSLTTAGTLNTPSGVMLLTGTPTAPAGTYSLTITAYEGVNRTLTSSPTFTYAIVLTGGVVAAPAITTQPVSLVLVSGSTAAFTVVATGSPTYQWRKDGAAIAGATSATLTLTNVQVANAGTYSVVVATAGDSVTSNNATLTVTPVSAAPAITVQPMSQESAVGLSATFSVTATGTPAPSYQWLKNSVPIIGANGASLTLAGLTLADAANYGVNVTNTFGTVTSAAATLNVNALASAPVIAAAPSSLTVSTGSTAVLSVTASGSPAPTYQWRRNGEALAGATSRTLVVTTTAQTAGTYSVVATNTLGSVPSANATLALSTTTEISRLINLSILTNISAADPDFTMGTVLGGTGTLGNKPLLVRAVGPSLGALGVPGTLDDPKLEMFAGSATFATNDNWGGIPALSNAFAQVGAFAYTAGNSRDAALFNAATPARDYTVRVSSAAAGGSGAVIAELYDATAGSAFTASTARLINVSVRKQIDAGATLTAGFVIGPIGGTVARTVLVRAIGPGLGVFGVPGTMPDPKLELFSGANVIAASDNWGGDAQLTAAGTAVGAFAIANLQSKDAMILVTLTPGNYTAQVTGSGPGGVALVEVYEVP
jgi:hypothetical protein